MADSSRDNIPGLQDFMKKLGVDSCDSSFGQLSEMIANDSHEQEAMSLECPEQTMRARWQDTVIEGIVGEGDSVLDIGCGSGDLLARIADTRNARVQGIEINEEMVLRCMERGLPVYHGDLESSLKNFKSKSYDFVILEETLQTLQNPVNVLSEILRVGRLCIVSFPNFAHWNVRVALGLGGRMPRTESLPNTWYNTPNIHLCSINDFLDWAKETQVTIHDAWVLVNGRVDKFVEGHNLTAEQAMFILEKN